MRRYSLVLLTALLTVIMVTACDDDGGATNDTNNDTNDATEITLPEDSLGLSYADNVANHDATFPTVNEVSITVNGLEVEVSASASDSNGSVNRCIYQMGDLDGRYEVDATDGQCATVTHTYDSTGAYPVVVTALDDSGFLGQRIAWAYVGVDAPDASSTEVHDATINGCLHVRYWLPVSHPRPYDALVLYTPYRIEPDDIDDFMGYLAEGFAVLMVEMRGVGDSCGQFDLFGTQSRSDATAIDSWIASEDWSSGHYCYIGFSGPGIMELMAATSKPEHLACAVIGEGDSALWERLGTKNGAWWPLVPLWVLLMYTEDALKDLYTRLPVLVDHIEKSHEYTRNTESFDERDVTDQVPDIDIPLLITTSWNDMAWGAGTNGAPYLGLNLKNPESAVLIYPGLHVNFDPDARQPMLVLPSLKFTGGSMIRAFLHHYLRGEGDAPAASFGYRYFLRKGGPQAALMNHIYAGWRDSDTWPPEGVQNITLHLRSGTTGTASGKYDGWLLPEDATVVSDATDTTGTEEGSALVTTGYLRPEIWDPYHTFAKLPLLRYTFPDMRRLEKDGIQFTSPPLTEDATIIGPVEIHLYAETDLYDFDWYVVISDVWGDGSSHNVATGFLRASLRNGYQNYEPAPEGPQEYVITTSPVGNVFPRGHRIRISIYQVNADDEDPASRHISILEGSTVVLPVHGELKLAPAMKVDSFDAASPGLADWDEVKQWMISAGFRGREPFSGEDFAMGLILASDIPLGDVPAQDDGSPMEVMGIVALDLGSNGSFPVPVTGIQKATKRIMGFDFDYVLTSDLEELSDYKVYIRCARGTDHGAMILTNASDEPQMGQIIASEGSVHCYDVPFVNWEF